MNIARLYCTSCGAEVKANGQKTMYGRRVHVLFVQLGPQYSTADVPENCDCGNRLWDGQLGVELAAISEDDEEAKDDD